MNEIAIKTYHSTFSVELTKENFIVNTYGFVINEGNDIEPKLIHYIHGDVTDKTISQVRMIFNYKNNGHFVERSVSGKIHISQKFVYNPDNNLSCGEFPLNVAGEKIQTWI